MKKTIWLSYDLGVRGDYPSLYRWLDEHDASECGDSVACLKIDAGDDDSLPDFIKHSLKECVSFSRGDRIYLIWRGATGSNHGRFVIGGRKASPWKGYNPTALEEDDV